MMSVAILLTDGGAGAQIGLPSLADPLSQPLIPSLGQDGFSGDLISPLLGEPTLEMPPLIPPTASRAAPATHTAAPASAGSDDSAIADARRVSEAFRHAVRRVQPTVVTIRTGPSVEVITRGSENRLHAWSDRQGDGQESRHTFNTPRRDSYGSGVIIDARGIILTSYHVVADAPGILVELPGGKYYEVVDRRMDRDTDLAVIWIEPDEKLPFATLGDSDKVQIGDWVLAMGSPFGLNQTVSAGIISGKERSLHTQSPLRLLQTDAAINPGNSGGPLVNLDGEVIGITHSIASRSTGYQGIGFVIPSNMAGWVMNQLVKYGGVQRGYLGVAVVLLEDDVAEKMKVGKGGGVLVTEIYKDTPAEDAGIKVGDVITGFDDNPVRSPRDLRDIVERSTDGDIRVVQIVRDGKPQQVKVLLIPTTGDLTDDVLTPPVGLEPGVEITRKLGFTAEELTPTLADRFQLTAKSGVVVSKLTENGPAHLKGLSAGDIILRVGGKSIETMDDFLAAIKAELPERGVLLMIQTKQGNRFLVLQARPEN